MKKMMREELEKTYEILKGGDPSLSEKLGMKKAMPDFFVERAYYGERAVADHYDFALIPWHDTKRNKAIIRNPFSSDPNSFVEIDDEIAWKVLVLGAPP